MMIQPRPRGEESTRYVPSNTITAKPITHQPLSKNSRGSDENPSAGSEGFEAIQSTMQSLSINGLTTEGNALCEPSSMGTFSMSSNNLSDNDDFPFVLMPPHLMQENSRTQKPQSPLHQARSVSFGDDDMDNNVANADEDLLPSLTTPTSSRARLMFAQNEIRSEEATPVSHAISENLFLPNLPSNEDGPILCNLPDVASTPAESSSFSTLDRNRRQPVRLRPVMHPYESPLPNCIITLQTNNLERERQQKPPPNPSTSSLFDTNC